MRIATYATDAGTAVGIVTDGRLLDLEAAFRRTHGRPGPASVLELIEGGPALLAEVRAAVEAADEAAYRDLSDIRLLAPIPRPRKNVFCVGRNYKLHIEEGARARGVEPSYPPVPEFFSKAPTSVIGPDEEIRVDFNVTGKPDYEVELAMVIGRRCRDVSASDAASVIFGYTVLNDITARDLQARHGQWFKGKSLDSFCPLGPVIVTADEFGHWAGHGLRLSVNGEERQNSTTSDMLFDCAVIIEHLSAGMTLEPGDIIATGTPSGVGLGLEPQVWLSDGDVIEAEVEGIGVLRNVVRAIR